MAEPSILQGSQNVRNVRWQKRARQRRNNTRKNPAAEAARQSTSTNYYLQTLQPFHMP